MAPFLKKNKVLYTLTFYSKYIRALTFENLCGGSGIPLEITSFRALVRVWQGEHACALARTG